MILTLPAKARVQFCKGVLPKAKAIAFDLTHFVSPTTTSGGQKTYRLSHDAEGYIITHPSAYLLREGDTFVRVTKYELYEALSPPREDLWAEVRALSQKGKYYKAFDYSYFEQKWGVRQTMQQYIHDHHENAFKKKVPGFPPLQHGSALQIQRASQLRARILRVWDNEPNNQLTLHPIIMDMLKTITEAKPWLDASRSYIHKSVEDLLQLTAQWPLEFSDLRQWEESLLLPDASKSTPR